MEACSFFITNSAQLILKRINSIDLILTDHIVCWKLKTVRNHDYLFSLILLLNLIQKMEGFKDKFLDHDHSLRWLKMN